MGFEIEILEIPVWISAWSPLLWALICFHAFHYTRNRTPDLPTRRYVLAAIFAAAAAILSLAAHEWAHAIVAGWVGIEITGAGLTGWGAYVDTALPLSETTPWKEIAIALAGPAMNFLIGAITAVPVHLLGESLLKNTIRHTSYVNIIFGRLNLLPIGTLDGGKVLHGLLWLLLGNSELASILVLIVSGIAIALWLLGKSLKTKLDNL